MDFFEACTFFIALLCMYTATITILYIKFYIMKKTYCFIVLLMASVCSFAQSRSTTVKFNKANTPALQLEVPYTEEIAEGAIIQKLKEIGYKPETSGALLWKKNTVDGYYVFKKVVLRDMAGGVVDLYFKVDRKSKKEKNQSYIYMIVGSGEDRFASSESEPDAYAAANRFLDGFVDYSASYKMDVDIQNQEESIKTAEKKYTKLKEEEKDLEERLRNNRVQQENQLKLMEAERQKLEALRLKKLNKA